MKNLQSNQHRFTILQRVLLLLLLSSWLPSALAGDLDDVSIQLLGLDELPSESMQSIPLPVPGAPSISDVQGDVLLNRPFNGPKVSDEQIDNALAPAPDAGTGAGGSPPQ